MDAKKWFGAELLTGLAISFHTWCRPGSSPMQRFFTSIQPHCEFIDDPLSEPEKTILRIPSCEPLKSFVEAKETIPLEFS